MGTITVDNLFAACKAMRAKGLGDRKILLSGDDEGNDYHEMFYTFSPDMKGETISYGLPFGVTAEKFDKEYILLG